MIYKMTRKLPVRMRVLVRDRLCVPLFLARVFDLEEQGPLKRALQLQAWLPPVGRGFGCALGLKVCHRVWLPWEQAGQQVWLGAPAPVTSTARRAHCWPQWETTPVFGGLY